MFFQGLHTSLAQASQPVHQAHQRRFKLLSATNLLYANDSGVSTEKSVTLIVEKMTCASCPYIFKKSLTQTEGVQSAEVIFDEKKAIVVFDESKTSVEQLIAATTNVGFPSELVETETN